MQYLSSVRRHCKTQLISFEETDCLGSFKFIKKNNSYEYSELILFEFTKTIIFLKTQLNCI